MQQGSVIGIVVGHHQNDPQWAYVVPGSAIQTVLDSLPNLPPGSGDATGDPSSPGSAPGPGLSSDDVRAIIREELAKLPKPETLTPDQVREIATAVALDELTKWRPKLPGRFEQYDASGKLIQAKEFTFGPDEPLIIKLRPVE